jgi:hypothetical protein
VAERVHSLELLAQAWEFTPADRATAASTTPCCPPCRACEA